jgi:hypothetical protein
MIAASVPTVPRISIGRRAGPGGFRLGTVGLWKKGDGLMRREVSYTDSEVRIDKSLHIEILERCECDACMKRRMRELACALHKRFGSRVLAVRGEAK